MSRYAANTEVPVGQSKAEIERTIARYGAEEFVSGWKAGRAMIQFRIRGRIIRFILALPDREQFRHPPKQRGRVRTDAAIDEEHEQASRQRWRALLLTIKAKLESAESKIEEFDTAFMGQIVLPSGQTVAETLLPQIALAYENGTMPVMLEYGDRK